MHVILEDMSGKLITELDLDDATADCLIDIAAERNCRVEDIILDAIRFALGERKDSNV